MSIRLSPATKTGAVLLSPRDATSADRLRLSAVEKYLDEIENSVELLDCFGLLNGKPCVLGRQFCTDESYCIASTEDSPRRQLHVTTIAFVFPDDDDPSVIAKGHEDVDLDAFALEGDGSYDVLTDRVPKEFSYEACSMFDEACWSKEGLVIYLKEQQIEPRKIPTPELRRQVLKILSKR